MSITSSAKLTINGNPGKGSDNGTAKGSIETAIFVVSQAKALAPVDTGRLRNSISYKTFDGKSALFNNGNGEKASTDSKISLNPENQKTVYAGTNIKGYSIYQEFGTKHTAPKPYLRPAGALARGSSVASVVAKIHEEEMSWELLKGNRKVVQF